MKATSNIIPRLAPKNQPRFEKSNLYINIDTGTVVLCTSDDDCVLCGVSVYGNKYLGLGIYSVTWRSDSFELYYGDVVITQK